MAFCKFSSELVLNSSTRVDNVFINEFLPYAPDACVKVYLYGLYKCATENSYDNTIESFSRVLGMSPEDIESAFIYWQEQGIVQLIQTEPFEVRYIPLKNIVNANRKIDESKYNKFIASVYEIIKGREVTKSELFEYCDTMERYKIEPCAMLMIMKYATGIKGENVGYHYILTIAKNWANENITTAESVEERLQEYEQHNSAIGKLLKITNSKRAISTTEHELYLKWQEMGFSENVIEFVAKLIKKAQNSVNFNKIDAKITNYYEAKLFSSKEIEHYETTKNEMFLIAKNVCRAVGVYYENLNPVVDAYISKWLAFGFDEETILEIASYCFKTNIKTLDMVDKQIQKFYKLGIVSKIGLSQYFEDVLKEDDAIKEILCELNLSRNVNSYDREFYKTWTQNWRLGQELIKYGANLASGKAQPMNYLNKILSSWNENNVKTVQDAEKIEKHPMQKQKKSAMNYEKRNYSKEQVNALFMNLEEIEI